MQAPQRRCGSHLNYAIYHDRYQRTPDGWNFTERVYEIRYLDTTPLAGSAPNAAGDPLTRRTSGRDGAGQVDGGYRAGRQAP